MLVFHRKAYEDSCHVLTIFCFLYDDFQLLAYFIGKVKFAISCDLFNFNMNMCI